MECTDGNGMISSDLPFDHSLFGLHHVCMTSMTPPSVTELRLSSWPYSILTSLGLDCYPYKYSNLPKTCNVSLAQEVVAEKKSGA
jgi:hypothetical protein